MPFPDWLTCLATCSTELKIKISELENLLLRIKMQLSTSIIHRLSWPQIPWYSKRKRWPYGGKVVLILQSSRMMKLVLLRKRGNNSQKHYHISLTSCFINESAASLGANFSIISVYTTSGLCFELSVFSGKLVFRITLIVGFFATVIFLQPS